MRRLTVILLTSFSLIFCHQAQSQQLKGEIQISGAFALYPLIVKWAEEFRKIYPNVRIDISGGGAGKGITDALARVVDLGMVSRDLYPVELQKGAMGIPVAKDAVLPVVNSANPLIKDILRTGLKKDAAKQLWSGKLKSWGVFLNINRRLPIRVFTRSDACGAAETWSAWFGMKQEDLEGTAVYGDPGVASAVQRDKVAIGYNNIAYIYDQRTKKPFPGLTVLPLDLNNNGRVDPEENFYDNTTLLIKAISEGRYPSPPARDLFLVSNGIPDNPVVIAFLKFILTKGQQYVNDMGFINLSKEELDRELKRISK